MEPGPPTDEHGGQLLAKALRAAAAGSITVGSVTVISDRQVAAWRGGATLIHVVASAPLSEILRDTMQPSDNFYAEMLFRLLGATAPDVEVRLYERTTPCLSVHVR